MRIWDRLELVQFAALNSPYYRELYKGCDLQNWEGIPILSQEDFWNHNTLEGGQVLTGKTSGIIFRSGGTTGNPKFSAFTMDEWQAFTSEFARAMDSAGFRDGDRVANLFYAGDLYASFLFINKSLENMKTKVISLPVAGHIGPEGILTCLREYRANTICGVPTTLMNLRACAKSPLNDITKVFYGGESLFDDQIEALREIFPNAHFSSVGYASVDGGHLGMAHEDDERGVHRTFTPTSWMEIIDEETQEVINTPGKSGKLVFTNLIRSLMPIIRYPVGDSAQWLEGHVGERFLLQGRTDEGARLGPVTFNRDDFSSVVRCLNLSNYLLGFQFEISRSDGLDELTIKVAFEESILPDPKVILNTLYAQRTMLLKSVEDGLIAAPKIMIARLQNLAVNSRTGKLKLVIDNRFK